MVIRVLKVLMNRSVKLDIRYEQINKVIQRVQYSQNLFIKNRGECPPRSGCLWLSRRRGQIFYYLAANMLGLVCHIGVQGLRPEVLRVQGPASGLCLRHEAYPRANHSNPLRVNCPLAAAKIAIYCRHFLGTISCVAPSTNHMP